MPKRNRDNIYKPVKVRHACSCTHYCQHHSSRKLQQQWLNERHVVTYSLVTNYEPDRGGNVSEHSLHTKCSQYCKFSKGEAQFQNHGQCRSDHSRSRHHCVNQDQGLLGHKNRLRFHH